MKKKCFKLTLCYMLLVMTVFAYITVLDCVEVFAENTDNKFAITLQPVDCKAYIGDNASFTIETNGEGVTYRWYYSKDAGATWNGCQYTGYRTNTLSFATVNYQYGYMFRCVVKDKYGNEITSNEATLLVKSLKITEQPQGCSNYIGDVASFTVGAVGNGLSYRWYYSKDGGTTWNGCQYTGYRTNTLSFTTVNYQYGYMFRCVVKDKYGNEITSNEAALSAKVVEITEQPSDCSVKTGNNVSFTVQAQGNGLSYRWYYSKDNGVTWNGCQYSGYKTNTLSFVTAKYQYGYRFRCIVTDKYGNQTLSDSAAIYSVDNAGKITNTNVSVFKNTSYETIDGYDTLFKSSDFLKTAQILETSVQCPIGVNIQNDDLVILRFSARAFERCGKIKVTIDGTSYEGNYILPVTQTDYFLPVVGYTSIDSVKIELETDNQDFEIGNFEIINCGTEDVSNIKTGMFDVNGEKMEIEEEESIGYSATDILINDDYLYTIHKGVLCIYEIISGDNISLISSLDGIGNCREIAVCNNGNTLAISARENGVYLVDVSDASAPYIISNFDTLEMATGIYVEGNYCFVCSRNFGVEIYDISDMENPKYCSLVSAQEEYYDCYVNDGYLYVTSWAQKKVTVYDANNPYSLEKVSTISLNGNGGGCVVEDNVLYVATGYHSTDAKGTNTASGYGMGNGIEIYDVSDPSSPQWLSTSKIDGRYYYSGFDHWKVFVSNGYAYLTSAYNGVYIYDVSDTSSPVRVDRITVKIPKSSSNYKKLSTTSYVFNFDTTSMTQGLVTSLAISDGYVFFATENGTTYNTKQDPIGLYAVEFEEAVKVDRSDTNYTFVPNKTENNVTSAEISGYTIEQYTDIGNIYSIAKLDDRYYCAAGVEGIKVFDSSFNELYTYKTQGTAKDIKINGQYIYVAEANKGMAVYLAEDNTLEEIGRCNYSAYNTTFSAIEISLDGEHILAQAGWTRYVMINVSDVYKPYVESTNTTGTMYYRNLATGLISDKYMCEFDRSYIRFFNIEDGVANVFRQFKNSIYSETNGMAVKDEYAVVIYNNGYVYFNPETVTESELSSPTVIKVPGAKYLKGKAVINDNIMVVSYEHGNQVTIIDISDLENPKLISQMDVEGNPDIAVFVDNQILIPLKHGGILSLNKK